MSVLDPFLSRRSLLAGGVAATTVAGLSACSSTGGAEAPPSVDASKPVTISFMNGMGSGAQKDQLEKVTKDFMAANANITVTLLPQPSYGDVVTNLTAQIAAGTPPTLGHVYGNTADELAASDVIVNLDEYVKTSDQYSDFFDGVKKDMKLIDGSTWMWPFTKSVVVQYYNEKMVPTAPTTWDEFATAAKKVSNGKVVALSIDPGSAKGPAGGTALFEILAEAFGDPVWDDQGKPQFTKPGVVKAMQWLVDLKKAGALALGTNYPGQTALGSQTGAFDVSSVASYPFNLKAVGDKFPMGVDGLPAGPAKTANQLAGANVVMVAKASDEQKAAAWKYLQFLTAVEQQVAWAEATGYLPVTKKALDDASFLAYAKKTPFVIPATKQLDQASATPPRKWAIAAGIPLSTAISAAVNSGADPEAALTKAQTDAETAVKDNS